MSADSAANGHSETPNGDSSRDSGVNGTSSDISSLSLHACELEGCDAPAKQKCPTCLELKLPESFFCTQEHFKLAWKTHKAKHAVKPQSSCFLSKRPQVAQNKQLTHVNSISIRSIPVTCLCRESEGGLRCELEAVEDSPETGPGADSQTRLGSGWGCEIRGTIREL